MALDPLLLVEGGSVAEEGQEQTYQECNHPGQCI